MVGGKDVILVIFRLVDAEYNAWREQRISHKAIHRIAQIQLTFTSGSVDIKVTIPTCAHAKSLSEAYSHHAILQVSD